MSVALHNDFPVQLKNTNNARPTLPCEFIMGEILTLAIHESLLNREHWVELDTKSLYNATSMPNFLFTFSFQRNYVSDRHSLIVLSFSKLALAIIFSVGWQAVQRTWNIQFTVTVGAWIIIFQSGRFKVSPHRYVRLAFAQFPWFVGSKYKPDDKIRR